MSTSDNSNQNDAHILPKVWKQPQDTSGSKFGAINRPTAGARFEQKLPIGKHALQLYSMGTPNGQKVTILLEELLERGIIDAEYDAWLIRIMDQEQFGSDFTAINPNSKIPALADYRNGKEKPTRVFESGSILLYLAEKFDNAFLPSDNKTEVMNWLFWQMGSAPLLGGGFGHFYHYADVKQEYPINRFTMEVKRQLDVLNKQLSDNGYIAGDEYTIADIAIFPWYGNLVLGREYGDAATFLNVQEEYPHVIEWAKRIAARPAVIRGQMVNRTWGDEGQLAERHDASDFEKVAQSAANISVD
jgi:GST-like protein